MEQHGKSATGLPVPPDVLAALDAGGRPPVVVTLAAHSYRTTIGTMGGQKLLPLSAENRAAAGLAAGDEVDVDLELDTAPREVELPADLAAALALDHAAEQVFAASTPSQRKEWVRWITDAKQEATRTRRVTTTVEKLRAGNRTR